MALKIAIIGAGPGGCLLARSLLFAKAPVDITIFEGEQSNDFRSQGGTLDLHTDTGLAALKEAGLYDEFLKLARFDGESLIVCDKKLTVYFSLPGSTKNSTHGRPEIDRSQLRSLLLDSLPADIIRWGHHLRKVDDDLTLHFDISVEKGFDLVIGADGAWSKVRALLSEQKPYYAGVGGHHLLIRDAKETSPATYKLVNRGSVFAYSDGKQVVGQQMGDGSITVYIYSVRDENWMTNSDYDVHDGSASKRAICADLISDWAPELVKFVQDADLDVTPRNLYMLPIGFRWKHRPGATLLGDAAHLMTFFAGQGVNTALEDAMELSRAIVKGLKEGGGEALDSKIAEYEEKMFKRATEIQQVTYDTMQDVMFTEGAPRSIIESWLTRHATIGIPSLLKPFVAAGIHCFYFFFKLFVR